MKSRFFGLCVASVAAMFILCGCAQAQTQSEIDIRDSCIQEAQLVAIDQMTALSDWQDAIDAQDRADVAMPNCEDEYQFTLGDQDYEYAEELLASADALYSEGNAMCITAGALQTQADLLWFLGDYWNACEAYIAAENIYVQASGWKYLQAQVTYGGAAGYFGVAASHYEAGAGGGGMGM